MRATARRRGGGIDHRVPAMTMAMIWAVAPAGPTDREHT
jgi:hypothetical protein